MVYRNLAVYLLIPSFFIALLLAINGVSRATFQSFDMYSFLKSSIESYNTWSFKIPDIPKIPTFDSVSFESNSWIISLLINIANAVISFINFQVTLFNLIIRIANIFITLFQFGMTMIWQLRDLISNFVNSPFGI